VGVPKIYLRYLVFPQDEGQGCLQVLRRNLPNRIRENTTPLSNTPPISDCTSLLMA
jgi:hypothetical protein